MSNINYAMLAAIVLATRDANKNFAYTEQGDDLNALITAGLVIVNPGMVNGSQIAAKATDAGMAEHDRNENESKPMISGFGSADQAGGFGSFGDPANNGGTAAPATTSAPVVTQPNPNAANVGSAENKTSFSIVGGFVPPAKAPRTAPVGGAAQEKYPFASLKAPRSATDLDAFFVPASAEMPDPVKSLTSAVSAANRRYATITGTKTNKKGKTVNVYKRDVEFAVFAGTQDNTPNGVKGAWIARTK